MIQVCMCTIVLYINRKNWDFPAKKYHQISFKAASPREILPIFNATLVVFIPNFTATLNSVGYTYIAKCLQLNP